MKLTHPKCGKQFPNGNRAGHCAACCETFIGLAAFEAHRVGEHGTGRRCEMKPYVSHRRAAPGGLVITTFGHWQDDNGYWHYGEKLTAEQKAELWPTSDETKPGEGHAA